MGNRTDQPTTQPSPFIDLPAGHAVNFDNHGTVWGTDTPDETQALIARERAAGTAIDEWNVTDRDGQPLRIVRLADPTFLDTICVFSPQEHLAATA
ncbi:hypothetical protein ACFVOR_14705 [Streptomyces sp. NPDC057837]|uniref:hypothetical protein n=1 Tax=Streptomyces sp. NPDC057837 TaxID=3346260 RepID=UPI0036814BD3